LDLDPIDQGGDAGIFVRATKRLEAQIHSSAQRRRRGKGKKAGPPVFDDHVKRVFRADAPNRVWLTDITEHRTTTEGKLYCCAIKDVFSNRIVGYSISDRMTEK